MDRHLVIIIGRNYLTRLGLIRALKTAGYETAVIQTEASSNDSHWPIDRYSKYAGEYFQAQEPDSEYLIKLLLEKFSGKEPRPILLPIDDYVMSVIDLNIDKLRGYFLYPNIQDEQGRIVAMMDKGLQKEIARSVGLNVVDGWSAVWNGTKHIIPDGVEFPCFIKPENSYKGANKKKMKRCNDRAELEKALEAIDDQEGYPILIERFIEIRKEYSILGVSGTDTVIPGVIESENMYYGITAAGHIYPIENYEGLGNMLHRFIEKLNYVGLFDIDMYVSSDGTLYFSELNLRFGASGYAVTASGINLPQMFCENLTGEKTAFFSALDANKSFANEKICLRKFTEKQISYRDYIKTIQSQDFCFVQDKEDPIPYRQFRKLVWKTRLIIIKKLLLSK